jgi:hypothetical protein
MTSDRPLGSLAIEKFQGQSDDPSSLEYMMAKEAWMTNDQPGIRRKKRMLEYAEGMLS